MAVFFIGKNNMAKVLSRLDILLHANTTNYVREMKKATDKTKQELKSVADYGNLVGNQLSMAFAGLGSAVSISHIVQTADRMQDLASKVRINTQSTEEYMAVLHDLRKISTDYWTAIDGITDLYASSKRALDSLGVSQREVLDFTRNITMAMSIGGGSAQAQEAALIQLGQAMNMGMLRGQEFNSVSAQAPVIIDLLTESLKVSRGELRQMAKEGKITSQVMKDAVLGGYDKLQNIINQMPTTFAQGLQNVKSQYDFLVDDIMNQNSLISQNLANAVLWVADNFRTLVGVGATMGAVWLANVARNSALVTSFTGLTSATLASTRASIANAFSVQGQINAYNVLSTRMMLLRMTKTHYINLTTTAIATTVNYARSLVGLATSFNTATVAARLHTAAFAAATAAKRAFIGVGILTANTITGIGSAFASLGRIILAHPIITLTAVIGAVIARTEGLDGAIKSLGDAFNVTAILAGNFINGVVDGLGMAWTAASNYFSNLMGGADKATSFAKTSFGSFFANTEKGFVGVLQVTARVFDLAGAHVVTFAQHAWKNISSLGTSIINLFKKVGNEITKTFEIIVNNQINKINSVIDGINYIAGMFGGAVIPKVAQVSFGQMQYGQTNYGFGGYSADLQSNNQHYLESGVLVANEQVKANQKLAQSYNDVSKKADEAAKAAEKKAAADKKGRKKADEAAKAQKKLTQAYFEQAQSLERRIAEAGNGNRHVFELDKIKLETDNASFGRLFALPEWEKNNLKSLAADLDTFEVTNAIVDKVRDLDVQKLSLRSRTMLDDMELTLANYRELLGNIDKFERINIELEDGTKVKPSDYLRKTVLAVEQSKADFEFWKEKEELGKELKLASQSNEISRQLLEFEQKNKDFISKYEQLQDKELFKSDFEELKRLADEHEAFQRRAFAIKESLDYINETDKEIAERQAELDVALVKGGKLHQDLYVIEQERQKTLDKYQALQDAGFTKEFENIKVKADELALANQKLVVQKAYKALTDNLMSDEEKRLETLKEQLNVINAQSVIMGQSVDIERAKQLISQSIGLATPTNPYEQLDAKVKNQYDTLDAGLKKLLENERLTEEERIKLAEWGETERAKIKKAYSTATNNLILSDSENMFGSLASIAKDGLGEQSRLYRIMFAMQQGFAIAQASIAMSQAMSRGLAEGFPKGLADMAMAAAHGAKIISAIKSVVMPVGQAHDGIMSVPKSGTWNLEKGERVLPRHTAQNLDNTLNRLNGRGETKVIINNYTSEKASVEQQPNGDFMVTIGKMMKQVGRTEAQQLMYQETRQNGYLDKLYRR